MIDIFDIVFSFPGLNLMFYCIGF